MYNNRLKTCAVNYSEEYENSQIYLKYGKVDRKMEEEKKIKVYVKQMTNKETGEKFNSYKAVTKQGKIDLRFTQDVKEEQRPTELSYIFVPVSKVNVNQKSEFPVMWVSEITKIEPVDFKQNINDYLD